MKIHRRPWTRYCTDRHPIATGRCLQPLPLTTASVTGVDVFCFSLRAGRYALLVKPINYTLCSVNIALFGSSSYHLGRKINADYIEKK